MQASTPAYKTTIAGAAMTVEHTVTLTLPPSSGLSRLNLCPDPSFEGATTPWFAEGAPTPTISLSSAHAFSGTKSLLVTWQTGSTFFPSADFAFATTPGLPYTFSAYVWVPSGSPGVSLIVGGIGFSAGSTLNDQWQRLTITFTATSTEHNCGVTPSTTPTAGQSCYVDALLMEQTSTLGSYFDGNTANAFWTVDPNRSTSQLNVNPYQDVSLTVDSLTVDRQLTTDMPDGTRLITGYPSAAAQLTLSGLIDQTDASKTIAWLLNPANPDSPLYRSDALGSLVTIKAGVYTGGSATAETFTVFTGSVDDYTVDVQAGTVTLTCLDYRRLFTKSPPLPLGAFSYDQLSSSYGANETGQLFTSGWVLNLMCESLSRYTSPPPRNLCVYRSTGHGGFWPETRWPVAVQVSAVNNNASSVPGKFAAQVPYTSLAQFFNNPPVGISNGVLPGDMGTSGSPWFVEGWIHNESDPILVTPDPDTGETAYAFNFSLGGISVGGVIAHIQIQLNATSLGSSLVPSATVITFNPGFNQTVVSPPTLRVANDGQWHYFAVSFNYTSTTTFTATFYVDGASETVTSGTMPVAAPTHQAISTANIGHYVPTESVQVTNEGGTPPSNNSFTPSALVNLDLSLNNLTAVPDTTGQDAWSVIQQIAEAEGGIAGFDELGAFIFINRSTLASQGSQRTITPTYSLKTLHQEVGASFVRNHIQVPVNQLQIQPLSMVWGSPGIISIAAGGTYSTVGTLAAPVVALSTITQIMPSGSPTYVTGYRAAKKIDGGGGPVSNLTMTVTQIGPSTITITVVNPNGFTVYLVTPANGGFPAGSVGLPAFQVGGRLVTAVATGTDVTTGAASGVIADSQWPPAAEGGAVTNPRGELLLAAPSNPFIQDGVAAQTYADDLLIDLYQPRPLWRNVSIVADPSLQLGDMDTITDPVTTLVDGAALIVGVHLLLSVNDWSQSLDLRAVGMPGGWFLGVVGKSELGVTTYL